LATSVNLFRDIEAEDSLVEYWAVAHNIFGSSAELMGKIRVY
jgi:hypothetical protein